LGKRNWKILEQLYYEQEGMIRDTVECMIIEDNGVASSKSSGESSDMSESEGYSGMEKLEGD
jgi:hypothetical protein